jgi:hypothetical protein
MREAQFVCDYEGDLLIHALAPLQRLDLGAAIPTVAGYWEDTALSAANALIHLALAVSTGELMPRPERMNVWHAVLSIAAGAFAPFDTEGQHRYRAVVLHILANSWTSFDETEQQTISTLITSATERGSEFEEQAQGVFALYALTFPTGRAD